MISDEISAAIHISVDKGAQALNSLGFILRSIPMSKSHALTSAIVFHMFQ